MRTLLLTAILIAAPVSTFAQAAPAPVAAPAADAAAKTPLTIDLPIETLAADPAARAIVDKNLPGLRAHSSYEMFKGMTLKQLQPMSGGLIEDQDLEAIEKGLAALNKAPGK